MSTPITRREFFGSFLPSASKRQKIAEFFGRLLPEKDTRRKTVVFVEKFLPAPAARRLMAGIATGIIILAFAAILVWVGIQIGYLNIVKGVLAGITALIVQALVTKTAIQMGQLFPNASPKVKSVGRAFTQLINIAVVIAIAALVFGHWKSEDHRVELVLGFIGALLMAIVDGIQKLISGREPSRKSTVQTDLG